MVIILENELMKKWEKGKGKEQEREKRKERKRRKRKRKKKKEKMYKIRKIKYKFFQGEGLLVLEVMNEEHFLEFDHIFHIF